MQRPIALAAAAALTLTGLVLPAAAAHADDEPSRVTAVSTLWSGDVLATRFAYDTQQYGRVELAVDGTTVVTKGLREFWDGTTTLRVARPAGAGPAAVTLRVTSCDSVDLADPATICTTRTAYRGTAVQAGRGVQPGQASAVSLLDRLTVRQETRAGSYERARFRLWNDADRDREDTRAEVLKSESSTKVTMNPRRTVKTGRWLSKYDGATLTVASKLDIDHLVPLAEAWQSGAAAWSTKKREAYANDLGYGASLIAVSRHQNRSKGDKDPAAWLPPAAAYRCAYVRNFIAVKSRWKLSVDPAEKAALTTVLAGCSSVGVLAPDAPVVAELIPKAKPKAHPKPKPKPKGGGSAYYRNCDAVRAAGKAPLRAGQPGYETPRLDRDGDGVACE